MNVRKDIGRKYNDEKPLHQRLRSVLEICK
jgi:hypothetical protein